MQTHLNGETMELKISKGNNKIGKVPNLSFPPGKSCTPDAQVNCLINGCYAARSYLLYPNVRQAWTSNWELWKYEPARFKEDLYDYLAKNSPKRFRYCVGGDMPDEDFYYMAEDIAEDFPLTQFLVYTKNYEWDYSNKPDNLTVVLSVWPSMDLPKNRELPWAWLEEDIRRNVPFHFTCPGGCEDCDHFCWSNTAADIVFPKH